MRPRIQPCLVALVLCWCWSALPAVAAEGSEGELLYGLHCASCHGATAHGDGALAAWLRIAPADLTTLAADNGGTFPARRVYESIDGRADVRGHGERRMPVWGLSFQQPGRTDDQEAGVRQRILALVAYLESLQSASP